MDGRNITATPSTSNGPTGQEAFTPVNGVLRNHTAEHGQPAITLSWSFTAACTR